VDIQLYVPTALPEIKKKPRSMGTTMKGEIAAGDGDLSPFVWPHSF
jgi:hypothetical protein